jgi:CRP-like cAMP-binding protein
VVRLPDDGCFALDAVVAGIVSAGVGVAVSGLPRRFVVVSGLPGSGKTTIARALAPLLRLPVIDKDEILERLFESKGIGDAAWRRQLSREADAILQSEASASAGAIVSSFWHVAGMPPDSGTPTDWVAALSPTIVQVHCECPPDMAAERFMRRTRHAGHLDATKTAADVLASIQELAGRTLLPIGACVRIDTTGPVVAKAVCRDIEAALERLCA